MANEWLVNENNPSPFKEDFPTLIGFDSYPKGMWKTNPAIDAPFKTVYPALLGFDSYPNEIWVVNKTQSAPFKNSMPLMEYLGAFCHAENLSSVKIPKSVKKIGPYAFTYTSLSEVTIASDCTYSETTFPKDCVINFYPD